jgi:hypothetical protein
MEVGATFLANVLGYKKGWGVGAAIYRHLRGLARWH